MSDIELINKNLNKLYENGLVLLGPMNNNSRNHINGIIKKKFNDIISFNIDINNKKMIVLKFNPYRDRINIKETVSKASGKYIKGDYEEALKLYMKVFNIIKYPNSWFYSKVAFSCIKLEKYDMALDYLLIGNEISKTEEKPRDLTKIIKIVINLKNSAEINENPILRDNFRKKWAIRNGSRSNDERKLIEKLFDENLVLIDDKSNYPFFINRVKNDSNFKDFLAFDIKINNKKFLAIKYVPLYDPFNIEEKFLTANELYKNKDYNGALKNYKDIMFIYDQNRPLIFSRIGLCYLKLNNRNAAINYLSVATSLSNDNTNDKDDFNFEKLINDISNNSLNETSKYLSAEDKYVDNIDITEENGISLIETIDNDEFKYFKAIKKQFRNVKPYIIGDNNKKFVYLRYKNPYKTKNINIDDERYYADNCFENEDYIEALKYYKVILDIIDFPDIELISKMGICYDKIGNFKAAYDYLKICSILANTKIKIDDKYDYSNRVEELSKKLAL